MRCKQGSKREAGHLQDVEHGVSVLEPGAAGGGALRQGDGQWLVLLHKPRAQPLPQQLPQRLHCRAGHGATGKS